MAGRLSEQVWEERRLVISRLAEGGLTAAEFCRREGIEYSSIMAWRQRFRRMEESGLEAESRSPFAEIVVEDHAPQGRSAGVLNAPLPGRAPVEIALPGGALVRLYPGADAALVRAAVEGVRSC